MPPTQRMIHQNLFHCDCPTISVKFIQESELSKDHELLRSTLRLDENDVQSLGIAPAYHAETGMLQALAISTAVSILIIEFRVSKGRNGGERDTSGREVLQETLCRPIGSLYAFDVGPLALSLWSDRGIRVTNAIDIQSAGSPKTRRPLASIQVFVADSYKINNENVNDIFRDVTHDPRNLTSLALRAWISRHVSQIPAMEDRFSESKVARVDTTKFGDEVLAFLAKSTQDAFRLEQKKPMESTQKFSTTWNNNKKQLRATADRFQHVIRKAENQTIRVSVASTHNSGRYVLPGMVAKATGQGAQLNIQGELIGKAITSITTIGRGDPTQAEALKNISILKILQGTSKVQHESAWVQKIWLMSDDFKWPEAWSTDIPLRSNFELEKALRPLNTSQITAIEHMLTTDNDTRVTLIQGPPGTGKTTVIATFVQFAMQRGESGIWLVAQSNVAVKNIAEKLHGFGLFDWRILVSSDFHEYWHEHLYIDIKANVILSDELNKPGALKDLGNCRVVLCTLSMLSTRVVRERGITKLVPLNTLVVDEASQIEVGDYIPVFTTYSGIRKVCFIGDDKQLPPYGQEEIEDLQSVFEIKHLREDTIFLDTQYRMPPQIGGFISQAIYDDQLKSNENHPVKGDKMACHFIDISQGQEEFSGTSWKNVEECKAVLRIASLLEADQKNYRVITPYEAQRSAIEDSMKEAKLNWYDKCFNVDSFQGNEDDYILISIVRSRELGFLKDLRRTNVMLTRCKIGMIICTNKAFMERAGKESLVGQLLDYYDHEWVALEDLEKML